MNYIVLNGYKSTLIKGLLISELPPITKPAVRTSIEEIDGRDGDIVTKLGYAAYDKKMEIGCYGDFNIDDIIQYFSSEGTAVFSNEPDKFYRYQILQAIDFDRLLRFKKATVVFHVQPFKFSSVDDTYTFDYMHPFEFEETTNGITCAYKDGVVSVKGTNTQAADFYIPIKPFIAKNNKPYKLNLGLTTVGNGACTVRVIQNEPLDEKSIGSRAFVMDLSRAYSWVQSGDFTYNYLYVKVDSNSTIDIAFAPNISCTVDSFEIRNRGNVISRPKMTIYGNGVVSLYLNETHILDVTLGSDKYITLDAATLNAYKDGILKNRSVSGDLKDLVFDIGLNTFRWNGGASGKIAKVVLEDYSRWI